MLQHRQVVADEGEWVVNLMCHAGDHASQSSQLLGLNELALQPFAGLVSGTFRSGNLLQEGILPSEVLLDPFSLSGVSEDDDHEQSLGSLQGAER